MLRQVAKDPGDLAMSDLNQPCIEARFTVSSYLTYRFYHDQENVGHYILNQIQSSQACQDITIDHWKSTLIKRDQCLFISQTR